MTKAPPRPRGGIAGLLLLFCVAGGAAGFAFDFGLMQEPSAWIAAQPGGRAAIGAGAAVVLIAASHALRLLLLRREPGESDARDHA